MITVLLPVTATTAGLLGLLGLLLVRWVHPPGAHPGHPPSANAAQAVTTYFEYVPLSILLLLLLELGGTSRPLVLALGVSLFLCRALHAEALRRSFGVTPLRRAATMANWAFLFIASLALIGMGTGLVR